MADQKSVVEPGVTCKAVERRTEFRKELESLINRHSQENGSNTPDFILADFLTDCLDAFDKAVNRRWDWFYPKDAVTSTGEADA